jgi:sigma-B regulation protein RsbU (phosphoserine phosphatase)
MGIPGTSASRAKAIDLHIGDRFYAFTDGIVEASNPKGEEYGMKRVIEDLRKLSVKHVQQALDDLYEQVCEFTEVPDQQDDITLLGFELT